MNKKKIIIGCTGSVATIKVPKLAEKFTDLGHDVIIVPTNNALHFLKSQALEEGRNQEDSSVKELKYEEEIKYFYPELSFVTDIDEWDLWRSRGDPVKHIELREWADILLIAPLDANTLAKLAHGLCDNLLTCIVRAWNLSKPLFFCPAMNTQMYLHPFTSQHINILQNLGYEEIGVKSKTLICGETGLGAMAEIDDIIQRVNMKIIT